MRQRLTFGSGLLLLLVLVLVAGCTPSPVSTLPEASNPAEISSAPVPTMSLQGDAGRRWAQRYTVAPEDMPLAPYMAALRRAFKFEADRLSDKEIRAWQEGRQDFLATCMKKQGFDYYQHQFEPNLDQNTQQAVDQPQLTERLIIPSLSADRDTVLKYGYGVTRPVIPDTDEQDQNTEYEKSLSLNARSKYSVALRGVDIYSPEYDPHSSEPGGCRSSAEESWPDPGDKYLSSNVRTQFEDLTVGLSLFFSTASFMYDSKIEAINQDWRDCMSGKGFMIPEADGFIGGPFAAFQLARRTARDGSLAPITADRDNLPGDQRSLVGSEAEIAIALADFDCRMDTNYLARLIAEQRRAEQGFVDTHQKALDQMLAYIEQEVE